MNKSPGAEEKFKEISAAYEVLVLCFIAFLFFGFVLKNV